MYQVRWALGSDNSQWWVDYVSDGGRDNNGFFPEGLKSTQLSLGTGLPFLAIQSSGSTKMSWNHNVEN